MAFSWEYNTPEVRAEAQALGRATLFALEAFMDAVVLVDPMEYGRTPTEPPDLPLRMLPFGGSGLVTIQIYGPDDLVLVLRVQWFGAAG